MYLSSLARRVHYRPASAGRALSLEWMDAKRLRQAYRGVPLRRAGYEGGKAHKVAAPVSGREVAPLAGSKVDLERAGPAVGTERVPSYPFRTFAVSIGEKPPHDAIGMGECRRVDPGKIDAPGSLRRPQGVTSYSEVERRLFASSQAARSPGS